MESVNNLILDYCIQNKVAISFADEEELNKIRMLFNLGKEPMHLWKNGGWVSFTNILRGGHTITCQIGPNDMGIEFIHLTAEEFFTLALPCRSILSHLNL